MIIHARRYLSYFPADFAQLPTKTAGLTPIHGKKLSGYVPGFVIGMKAERAGIIRHGANYFGDELGNGTENIRYYS